MLIWFDAFCGDKKSRDYRLLSNHYIFSSKDHAVRHFYLVFDPCIK